RESSSTKVYSRVKTAIVDAQSLRLMPNRVRVQVLAACLLWPADEARARSVIRDATAATSSYLTSLDKSERDAPQIRLSYNRLRNELVTLIAARDAKLALEFLRATRIEPPFVRSSQARSPDQELLLEVRLASQIAKQDSRLATQIAKNSLSRDQFAGVLDVALGMRQSDAKSASDLAAKLLTRLKPENIWSNADALNIAMGLLSIARTDQQAQGNQRADG